MKIWKVWLVCFLVPLIFVVIGGSGNSFGFPFPFVLYKGGHYEALPAAYEVLRWENMKRSSFQINMYLLNVIIVYFAFVGTRKLFLRYKS